MQQLALRLGRLMLDITEQLNSDPEVSDALALLVADLFKCVVFLVESSHTKFLVGLPRRPMF